MDESDQLRRFILEEHPVRGHWVHLGAAWRQLRAHQHYPPAIEALLGETVTAAVLLAATLKFDGRLTLQLTGSGPVGLLVAQCTHDFRIRAVAQHDAKVSGDGTFRDLVGNGRLVVTIETGERASRYQGIVPLDGASMGECIARYFATSEQLPTRLSLAADATTAAGVLIQKLPERDSGEARSGRLEQVWDDLQQGLAALTSGQLLAGAVDESLQRLCGAYDCRLFAATAVSHACGCSPERVAELLRSLGAEEVRSVLAEQGAVSVTCEFCQRPYRFDAVDVERLFAPGAVPAGPASIN